MTLGAVLEIGDNLNTLGLALLVLIPQLIPLLTARRARAAAEQAAETTADTNEKVGKIQAEFSNNGGSTMLDKIEAAGRHTAAAVAELADATRHTAARVDAMAGQLGTARDALDGLTDRMSIVESKIPNTEENTTP